ncbi:MAG: Gfo/Idh/MocA family oxidoreductase [Firmicutes bacterium]|jgi:predicted dehydrogenase|nr:Gfo/Idh/MocA family oxidoreductase [Bacillota bacterium]
MAEAEVVRLGFIGCGSHARLALYPQIHRIPELDLVAVCDLNESRRTKAKRDFGARHDYADFRAMCDEQDLDAVCIVGPPTMQYEIGMEILKSYRLPIFVEKPPTLTYAQALELAQATEEAGVWGMTGFMKRFAPAYVAAERICRSEEFGRVTMVDLRYTHGPYPLIWGLSPEPYCCLVGNSCHIFDLARFFGGDVAEVYARLWYPGSGGSFAFAITLAFVNGAVGVINCNGTDDTGWIMREYCAVSGLCSSVEVEDMIHLRYRRGERWEPGEEVRSWVQAQTMHPHAVAGSTGADNYGYYGELRHFARCVLGKESPRSTLLDGAKSLQMAEAIWQSSQSQKPVSLI